MILAAGGRVGSLGQFGDVGVTLGVRDLSVTGVNLGTLFTLTLASNTTAGIRPPYCDGPGVDYRKHDPRQLFRLIGSYFLLVKSGTLLLE